MMFGYKKLNIRLLDNHMNICAIRIPKKKNGLNRHTKIL